MAISNLKLSSAETTIVSFLANYLISFDLERRRRMMSNLDELKAKSTFCQISWNGNLSVKVTEGLKTDTNLKTDDLGLPGEFDTFFDVSSIRDLGLLYPVVAKAYEDFKKKAPSLVMETKEPLKMKITHEFGMLVDVGAVKSICNDLKNQITWKFIETPSFKSEFSDWYRDVFLSARDDRVLSESLYQEFVIGFNKGKSFSFKGSSLIDVVSFFNDTKSFGYHVDDGDKVALGDKLVEAVLSKFLTGDDENDFNVLDSAVDIMGHDTFTSKVFKSLNADFKAIQQKNSFMKPVEQENKLISLNEDFFRKGFEQGLSEIKSDKVDLTALSVLELQKKVLSVATHPYLVNVSNVEKFDLVKLGSQDNLCVLKVKPLYTDGKFNDLMVDIMEYLSSRIVKNDNGLFNPANPFENMNNPQEQENLRAWCKMKELKHMMSGSDVLGAREVKEGLTGFKI